MPVTLPMAIVLSVTYQVTPEKLVVSYEVVNDGQQPVYIFGKAYKAGAKGLEPRNDGLLVSFDPPDTAVLAGKLLPIPPGMTFTTPPTALGTLVKPSQRLTAQATLPLPLRLDAGGKKTGRVSCRHVIFALGYVVDDADLNARPTNLKLVFQLSRAAWNRQQIAKTAPQKLRVDGLVKP